MSTKTRWLETFSELLRSTPFTERASVFRDAEDALCKLRRADLLEELQYAEYARADEQLVQWLRLRLEPPEVRRQQASIAFISHIRTVQMIEESDDNIELALPAFEESLKYVLRSEDPESWAQIQHNLAETYVRRQVGARTENLERAIAAFRVALPERKGKARIDTLLGLAQALRQRQGGIPKENVRDGEKALDEAERLLEKESNDEQQTRIIIERSRWEEMRGNRSSAMELLRAAKRRIPEGILEWHLRDREGALLASWAAKESEQLPEAISINRALLDHPVAQMSPRRMSIVRNRLLHLGVTLEPPTRESILQEELRMLDAVLGDERLNARLISALELRVRNEERAAFKRASNPALALVEGEMASIIMRLVRELHFAKDDLGAIGYLAHLGGWPLRRALRWVDVSARRQTYPLRWSRVLETRLTELMSQAKVMDALGNPMLPPLPPSGAVERVRNYLTGAQDNANFSPDDLAVLLSMSPHEREAAANEISAGIERGIASILEDIEGAEPMLFNSLTSPPFVAPTHIARLLARQQAFVIIATQRDMVAIGAVWRSSDDRVHGDIVFDSMKPERSALDEHSTGLLPIQSQINETLVKLHAADIERIGLVCRGFLARLSAMEFGAGALGRRLVHLPGIDKADLPPVDRSRADRILILLDEDPDINLPNFVVASKTLEVEGFRIFRPGPALDEASAAAIQNARCVIMVGHGDAAVGPLGPMIGNNPVSHFDQLPLFGSEWSACIACAVGDSARMESAIWDRDDPYGAAEALLLAGTRAAADCLRPVPEVVAAMLIEEFGIRACRGEEPERALADTLAAHRVAWLEMSVPLASFVGELEKSPEAEQLSTWVTGHLDGVRRQRLAQDVAPLPPLGVFRKLGGPLRDHYAEEALRKHADELLAPITSGDVWGAFRWMGRK